MSSSNHRNHNNSHSHRQDQIQRRSHRQSHRDHRDRDSSDNHNVQRAMDKLENRMQRHKQKSDSDDHSLESESNNNQQQSDSDSERNESTNQIQPNRDGAARSGAQRINNSSGKSKIPEFATIQSQRTMVVDIGDHVVVPKKIWDQIRLAAGLNSSNGNESIIEGLQEQVTLLKRKLAIANRQQLHNKSSNQSDPNKRQRPSRSQSASEDNNKDRSRSRSRKRENHNGTTAHPSKVQAVDVAPADAQESASPDDIISLNAVQLSNYFSEIYNQKIDSQQPMHVKHPMINKKIEQFMQLFNPNSIQSLTFVNDDYNQTMIVLENEQLFKQRYQCVFTESGTNLTMKTWKRFYFEEGSNKNRSSSTPTFCLDFESHSSVVSAKPGTPADGRLGLTKPRSQNLIVLYKVIDSKIEKIWLGQDKQKLSEYDKEKSTIGEQQLIEHNSVKPFLELLKKEYPEVWKNKWVYSDYHEIPEIG